MKQVDRIYTPEEYAELILKASTKNRFSVYQVKTLKVSSSGGQNHTKKLRILMKHLEEGFQNKKEKVLTYKQFLYSEKTRGKVIAKLFIDGFTKSTFT